MRNLYHWWFQFDSCSNYCLYSQKSCQVRETITKKFLVLCVTCIIDGFKFDSCSNYRHWFMAQSCQVRETITEKLLVLFVKLASLMLSNLNIIVIKAVYPQKTSSKCNHNKKNYVYMQKTCIIDGSTFDSCSNYRHSFVAQKLSSAWNHNGKISGMMRNSCIINGFKFDSCTNYPHLSVAQSSRVRETITKTFLVLCVTCIVDGFKFDSCGNYCRLFAKKLSSKCGHNRKISGIMRKTFIIDGFKLDSCTNYRHLLVAHRCQVRETITEILLVLYVKLVSVMVSNLIHVVITVIYSQKSCQVRVALTEKFLVLCVKLVSLMVPNLIHVVITDIY